jgi:hypothetical protein
MKSNSKQTVLKPGIITPTSGQYVEVGPNGGNKGSEVTSTEGNPLPPTSAPNRRYVLVDKTRHKDHD